MSEYDDARRRGHALLDLALSRWNMLSGRPFAGPGLTAADERERLEVEARSETILALVAARGLDDSYQGQDGFPPEPGYVAVRKGAPDTVRLLDGARFAGNKAAHIFLRVGESGPDAPAGVAAYGGAAYGGGAYRPLFLWPVRPSWPLRGKEDERLAAVYDASLAGAEVGGTLRALGRWFERWRPSSGRHPAPGPPFAAELAHAPRHPEEPGT